MKRKYLSILLVILLTLALVTSCAKTDDGAPTPTPDTSADADTEGTPAVGGDKDEIVIGAVRSQSGVFALFDQVAFGPAYRLWVDEVNEAGGIYVEEYGKQLPVRLIIYDDTSDMGTMTQLLQKLITEDEVDFLLPPVSTAFLNAAVPITAQYDYMLISAEGASTSLRESLDEYPNFFSMLNYSETQVPALAEMFKEEGITSAFIVYIQDTHGIEYSDAAAELFPEAGIEILGMKAVPPDIQDMSPLINEAKESGAQAFCLFTYPDQSYPSISLAKAMDYNPDVFMIGSGGSFESLKLAVGEDQVEGIICWGAWNTKSSEECAAFAEKLKEHNSADPGFAMDWWGHLPYYAELQVLQEAIEKTGTLDNTVVADYIKNNHFTTVMGDTYFVDQELAAECYKGQIGQWQDGYFEVIDVGSNRTANPIIPKQPWA